MLYSFCCYLFVFVRLFLPARVFLCGFAIIVETDDKSFPGSYGERAQQRAEGGNPHPEQYRVLPADAFCEQGDEICGQRASDVRARVGKSGHGGHLVVLYKTRGHIGYEHEVYAVHAPDGDGGERNRKRRVAARKEEQYKQHAGAYRKVRKACKHFVFE